MRSVLFLLFFSSSLICQFSLYLHPLQLRTAMPFPFALSCFALSCLGLGFFLFRKFFFTAAVPAQIKLSPNTWNTFALLRFVYMFNYVSVFFCLLCSFTYILCCVILKFHAFTICVSTNNSVLNVLLNKLQYCENAGCCWKKKNKNFSRGMLHTMIFCTAKYIHVANLFFNGIIFICRSIPKGYAMVLKLVVLFVICAGPEIKEYFVLFSWVENVWNFCHF